MDIGISAEIGLIEPLSKLILSEMNRVYLRTSYQQARFGDRLYGYQELVFDACVRCLRSYMGQVYCFDGTLWRPLSDIVLENALNKALVEGGVPRVTSSTLARS